MAYPVITSYLNKNRLTSKEGRSIETELLTAPKEDLPPPPPPPPPPPEIAANRVKFTVPIVVEDSVQDNIPSQGDLESRPNPGVTPDEDVIIPDKPQVQPTIEEKPRAEIFTVVEEQPSFPGGDEARIKYLQENLKYPEEAKEIGTQGRVFLTFVIETDGSITDVKILRGIGSGCDEEAIRVVKTMPKWIPGKQRGNPVRVQFNLPVRFVLQ